MDLYFEGERVARVVMNPGIQDSFPWYQGRIELTPEGQKYRSQFATYGQVDLEFDYCPGHPDEGPYEETDLCAYAKALTAFRAELAGGAGPEQLAKRAEEEPWWLEAWAERSQQVARGALLAELEAYLRFLDPERWDTRTEDGVRLVGIPLPPSFDPDQPDYAWRATQVQPRESGADA